MRDSLSLVKAIFSSFLYCVFRSRKAAAEMCNALGLSKFTTVDVLHKTRAYGVCIKHRDGWSIVCVSIVTYIHHTMEA